MTSLTTNNNNNNNIVNMKYDKLIIEEECMALQAIFGEEKCKIIKMKAPSNTVDNYMPPRVAVDLYDTINNFKLLIQVEFQFPKYYPIEEGVRIRVVNSNNLSKDLVEKTLSLAKILSSEKLGDAMIYDIVMDLQDFLIKEINNNNMNSNNNLTNQHDEHKAEKVRVISDVKNSNYYFSQNQLGSHNNKPTKIIMKRQCTEDIKHFSDEEFISNGFKRMNYGNNNSNNNNNQGTVVVNEYNVWRYDSPEIIIIQNPATPTEIPLDITAKHVEREDLDEWLELFLSQYNISSEINLLHALIEWVKSYLELAVADGEDVETNSNSNNNNCNTRIGYFVPEEYTLEKLPDIEEMESKIGKSIETGRTLHIITWGDKKERKHNITQLGAEVHFNAKPLDGRGGGADLKVNATQDPRIVRNVVQSMMGGVGKMWLERAIDKIEQGDLHCISTFCAQGRHRSVSSALILKAKYYPNATFQHIKMK